MGDRLIFILGKLLACWQKSVSLISFYRLCFEKKLTAPFFLEPKKIKISMGSFILDLVKLHRKLRMPLEGIDFEGAKTLDKVVMSRYLY